MRNNGVSNIEAQSFYKINFYAVGQGLFSSGHINLHNYKYNGEEYVEAKNLKGIMKELHQRNFSRDIIKDIVKKINVPKVWHRREKYLTHKLSFLFDYRRITSQEIVNEILAEELYLYDENDIETEVKKFHFVYDCGTVSSLKSPSTPIKKQIDDEFSKNMGRASQIS
ncbi:MAG: Unknown protein [uncultured Sulfurovum sp.]|uniref:Uncharacterized protein n=1 Tax=uncultured Sulfurovum sp. TaxID=269237 RepID=A0A6S6U5A4_9BACT|nr:MAG: Unknown protein [uncultured Sulfurovum sp.]